MVDASFSLTASRKRSTLNNVMHTKLELNKHTNENKSNKFRWSSCFSFIKRIKKPKSKLRLSHSHEDLHYKQHIISSTVDDKKPNEVITLKSSSIPWKDTTPIASLSPPPRQSKNKRESHIQTLDESSKTHSYLSDPTLTPTVRPRLIKSKKKSSLLRLSLDADYLNSPDDTASISTFKTSQSSSISLTPSDSPRQSPYKSGTLGVSKSNSRLSNRTSSVIPPLPSQIGVSSIISVSTHNRRSHLSDHYLVSDSPTSMHTVDSSLEDKEVLSLKERRRRRSPLSMPDTEQLTLALQEFVMASDDRQDNDNNISSLSERKNQSHCQVSTKTISHSLLENDIVSETVWRQQLLEKTIAFSLQNKSRQEAMLCLEGKSAGRTFLQPIVHVDALDYHFEHNADEQAGKKYHDVTHDKAQYDAVVLRTMIQHPLSSPEDRKHPKCISTQSNISNTENTNGNTTQINNVRLPLPLPPHMIQPQTPPHHTQSTPSLISTPSTPNSIDSSVTENNEYLDDDNSPSMLPSIAAIILH